MKIVILTGNFYPEIHPRSFRATELAKEFVRKGHDVTVVCCRTVVGFDYDDFERVEHIKIIRVDVYKGDKTAGVSAKRRTTFFNLKRFFISYLLCGNLFRYVIDLSRKLTSVDCLKSAEMVISLSLPFSNHYGLARYIKKNGKSFIAVADSGDPFYYSQQSRRAIWFKFIENEVYKQFDYLSIPTGNAFHLYAPLIDYKKIKIIPQGFNMRDIRLYKGERTLPVKFAYAGVFYWDIRNPEFLFKFLDNLNMDFRFHIFMRYKDVTLEELINKYRNLSEKIIMHLAVSHDELLYELSKMHFLINIENVSNTQMPSKLIDYGMTGRPIYSCKSSNFDKEQFIGFLSGDYSTRYKVNIADFNIEQVADRFLELK